MWRSHSRERTSIPHILQDECNQTKLPLDGVCRQLGIFTYHPSLQALKVDNSRAVDALVPNILLKLIQSIMCQNMLVSIMLEEKLNDMKQSVVVDMENRFDGESCLVLEDAVVSVGMDGLIQGVFTKLKELTQTIPEGLLVEEAYHTDVLEEPELDSTVRKDLPLVCKLSNS